MNYTDITKQKVIDIAWKTEGLARILEERNDPQADLLMKAQVHAHEVIAFQDKPDPQDMTSVYQVMDRLSNLYNYDSGVRVYENR